MTNSSFVKLKQEGVIQLAGKNDVEAFDSFLSLEGEDTGEGEDVGAFDLSRIV